MISGPTGRGRYSLLNGYLALVLLLWQGNAPVDVSQVTTALRENRFSTALQLTKGLLVRGAQDPQIWTLQGLAHEGLKEPAEALHDFKQALSSTLSITLHSKRHGTGRKAAGEGF
jgi:hypothetical protein